MNVVQQGTRVGLCLCLSAATLRGFPQDDPSGGPLSGRPIFESAFSADATTTVHQTQENGTRIERRATARYYRDRAGHVRVEQMLAGVDQQNSPGPRERITIIPDTTSGAVYTLDATSRTASIGSRSAADWAVGGGDSFAVPLGGARFLVFVHGELLRRRSGLVGNPVDEELLGNRQIAGLHAIGRRITTTILVGQAGNSRPMEIVDERWDSPQLRMVVYARHVDPRTGVIEYRLTNVNRGEPAPDLFAIPDGYTVSRTSDDWIKLEFADPPHGTNSAGR
jgi:hypothetical protein